ncbi:hypothetical protein BDQ17DRAFT_1428993 [Cyathus striatus]|nr:hypothetical protein BDQ17DRAFT_1428993 [Cyathus striatus]
MIPESVLLGWKISITLLHTIAILSTLLRLLRRYKQSKLWWDDAAAFVALLGLVIAIPVMWLLFINTEPVYTKKKATLYWLLTIPFFITIWSTRLSLSFSLQRLFPTHHIPKALSTVYVLTLIALLTWECTIKCDTKAPYLDRLTFLHCPLGREALTIGSIIADITADFLLTLTSLSLLWRIHLPRTQRTLVRILFSASVLTLLSAIVFCICSFSPAVGGYVWGSLVKAMVGELEMGVAVIVCNIQVLVTWVYNKRYNVDFEEPESISGLQTRECTLEHAHCASCFLASRARSYSHTRSRSRGAAGEREREVPGWERMLRDSRVSCGTSSLALTEVCLEWSDTSTFRSRGWSDSLREYEGEGEEVVEGEGEGKVGEEMERKTIGAVEGVDEGAVGTRGTVLSEDVQTWLKDTLTLPPSREHGGIINASGTPEEQGESRESAHKLVLQTVESILGKTSQVVREALVIGSELAKLAPVPCLQPLAATLAKIWEGVNLVQANQQALLRLTCRCAVILDSIRQQIEDSGNTTTRVLSQPLYSLESVFDKVLALIMQETKISFFERFLQRRDIVNRISDLNTELMDAQQKFHISVTIRILNHLLSSPEHMQTRNDHSLNKEQILPTIHKLFAEEDNLDSQRDKADLRELMLAALTTGRDADLVSLLQIARTDMPKAIESLQRALATDTYTNGLEPNGNAHVSDPLNRVFIERGLGVLRRMSMGMETPLPSWTITRFEVGIDRMIGVGFFSNVYKGTWKGRTVAIKVLSRSTSRASFVHEMKIWKDLKHVNVIELCGASSIAAEPSWFFVIPYMKNGDLGTFLRHYAFQAQFGNVGSNAMTITQTDLYRFMMEIAEGMAYLHAKGILHDDLKASNVLVDDGIHCVVSDFGQSVMKSEVYRKGGEPVPGGTLHWQAPENLRGHRTLIGAADVYAYAITCIEVLKLGDMPWPSTCSDRDVRSLVLNHNSRPQIPPLTLPDIQAIIRLCWNEKRELRPPFHHVVSMLHYADARRPFFHVPQEDGTSISRPYNSRREHVVPYIDLPEVPQSVAYTPSASRSSSSFSRADTSVSTSQANELFNGSSNSDHEDDSKNEEAYRNILDHKLYHGSLSLPLWAPTPVKLGDVGYFSKGRFITLFNAFEPFETSHGRTGDMPSITGYGTVLTSKKRGRIASPKGWNLVARFRKVGRMRTNDSVHRPYSFSLPVGNRVAYMCTEGTEHQYIEKLDPPRRRFKVRVDTILSLYGAEHSLQREDVLLVIGALQATKYGLFVGYNYPEGQVHFNVFPSAKDEDPWGAFTTEAKGRDDNKGPIYDELTGEPTSASKVSRVGDPPSTVLLARLCFKPGAENPTLHDDGEHYN